jgi:Uma2 family endonuclease
MPVSEATYLTLALEDPEGHWELVCGRLRQKPGMTAAHNHVMAKLFFFLMSQLDQAVYAVRSNAGHIRRSSESYYIPDVYVVPIELERAQMASRTLEVYSAPLPLVVEVWSPSTGEYDVDNKLREYQQRGDLEIWRIHPYERTLTSWVRQADGTYTSVIYTEGSVSPAALPGVVIDLARLFA